MRDMHEKGLWARLLRFHRSQSPSGPCAEWRTQQPSSGCEGDDHMDRTLTAVRPSLHGGTEPAVASRRGAREGYACEVCRCA